MTRCRSDDTRVLYFVTRNSDMDRVFRAALPHRYR
jgi:hypothetical protein